jgi:hypothetical protein
MNMKRRILSLAAAAALLCACSDQQDAPPATRDLAAEGAALLAPFKSSLMQALSAGMQEGPAAAIDVCSVKAPRIAEELSVDGVRMGRSSHKLRNPDNAPPDWLVPVLEDYTSREADLQPRTVEIAADRHGYVEPIITQPLCLTCHGSALDADVAASIAERYPEDRATGFEAGDLRGVFWVEY